MLHNILNFSSSNDSQPKHILVVYIPILVQRIVIQSPNLMNLSRVSNPVSIEPRLKS